MTHININGTECPVNFGTAAIMDFEEMSGLGFYEFLDNCLPPPFTKEERQKDKIDEMDDKELEMYVGSKILQRISLTNLVQCLYSALYGGAKKAGTPTPFSFDELIDILDEIDNRLEVCSAAFALAFQQLPQAPAMDEQQKKRLKEPNRSR